MITIDYNDHTFLNIKMTKECLRDLVSLLNDKNINISWSFSNDELLGLVKRSTDPNEIVQKISLPLTSSPLTS